MFCQGEFHQKLTQNTNENQKLGRLIKETY